MKSKESAVCGRKIVAYTLYPKPYTLKPLLIMKNNDWHFDIDLDFRRQLAAIDELIENGGDEELTCKKLKIKPYVWQRWLKDKIFHAEIHNRLAAMQRRNNIMQVSYKSFAMAKLLSLCSSENEETCRKACIDLLKLKSVPPETMENSKLLETEMPFSDDAASKILEILANDKHDRGNRNR